MNILEALKSGRRFKLPSWDYWYDPKTCGTFAQEVVLRDDWEIEPEPKKPREFWIVKLKHSNGAHEWLTFLERSHTDKFIDMENTTVSIIHVREVLE